MTQVTELYRFRIGDVVRFQSSRVWSVGVVKRLFGPRAGCAVDCQDMGSPWSASPYPEYTIILGHFDDLVAGLRDLCGVEQP